MSVSVSGLLGLILAAGVAVVAAVCDIRWRRIPNWITVPAIVSGVALHMVRSGWHGLATSLWGMVIGGGILLVFYILGGMGAGDVKLMGGIGALLGPRLVLAALVLTGIAGGFMAMGKLVARYGRRHGSQKPELTGKQSQYKVEAVMEDGIEEDPMKETIPYGVAIAAGTILSLALLVLV
jgi:prepilin peptidase CpaA